MTTSAEAVWEAAEPVLSWLWRATWQGSVVIGVVLLLQWVLRRQLPARWRHGLWLVVVARLLLPWCPESPVSVFNVFGAAAEGMAVVGPGGGSAPEGNGAAAGAKEGRRAGGQAGSARWMARGAGWVWAAGVVWLGGYLWVANWRLGRKVRRERPVTDAGVLGLLEDCKEEMGVRTPVTVVETGAVSSPALLGFIRPRLLLPRGLMGGFSRAELRFLFLHELAHVKRGDVPLNWVGTMVLLAHWFNPLVWYACSRMRADGELACDALALRRMRSAETEGYGRTLIKLLESFSRPAMGPGLVGVVETKNQMKERIRMIAKFGQRNQWPVLAATVATALGLVTLTDAQTGGGRVAAAAVAGSEQGPPRIVSTTPEAGATEVDPGLKEIRVTFDREMGGGFSWTGGGPEYPPMREGEKAHWEENQRTCVLPVKLEAGKYYRVGINSTSYKNFRSAAGVPALPSAIYFTTKGASEELKAKATKPQIVGLSPKNGDQDVDPGLQELRVTFNVPMGGGCSWTGGGPDFPTIPEGKKVFWTEDQKTCVLPVSLEPGHTYRLGLNSPSHKNFQSAGGVPLDPVRYSFKTRE